MFKREEAARLRQEFWTTFGKYMSPVPSAEGEKINWINYRTAVKHIFFRMEVNQQAASIAITLQHPDAEIRALQFHQFETLKTMLHAELQEEWTWQPNHQAEGKTISIIYNELPGVSVFNKDQWPQLISFFKPRLIALDRFWQDGRYTFNVIDN